MIDVELPKFAMQETSYGFPYHHVPQLEGGTTPLLARSMGWGMEYLCYTTHVVDLVTRLAPRSVLDVGCGDGRLLSLLPKIERRLGVDLSERAIRFATMFSDASFAVADVRELSETFDIACCIEVLEHIPDEIEVQFLAAIGARVKPGGHIILSVPSIVRPVHPKHYRHYSEHRLRKAITAALPDWEVVSLTGLFQETMLDTLFRKATQNRFWQADVPIAARLLWRGTWRNRVRPADRGAHLIAICRAP